MIRNWILDTRLSHVILVSHVLILTSIGVNRVSSSFSECEKKAPNFLNLDQRRFLCGNSTSEVPADCAIHIRSSNRFSLQWTLEICREAASIRPSLCIVDIPLKLSREYSKELQFELCYGETSSDVLTCIQNLRTSKLRNLLTNQEQIMLCKGGNLSLPLQCYNALPSSMSPESKLSLCKAAKSTAPALCASALPPQIQENISQILCIDAASIAPAYCFIELMSSSEGKRYGDINSADLCRNAESIEPASCFKSYTSSLLPALDVAMLCRGSGGIGRFKCISSTSSALLSFDSKLVLCQSADAFEPLIPLECYSSAPINMPTQDKVNLCTGAKSIGPSQCINVSPYWMSLEAKLQLCRGALTDAPAKCAQQMPYGIDSLIVASLCSASNSDSPAECFKACPLVFSSAQKMKLCKAVGTIRNAKCVTEAIPSSNSALKYMQCPVGAHTSTKHRFLSFDFAVALCIGVEEQGDPISCALNSPVSFSDEDVLVLCGNSSTKVSADCAQKTSTFMPPAARAEICRNSNSTWPAQCADALLHSYRSDVIISLCHGVNSLSPAYCMNTVQKSTESNVQFCRSALPVPTSILLRKYEFPNDKIYVNEPIRVVFAVFDQWYQLMEWDNGTIATASIVSNNVLKDTNMLKIKQANETVNGAIYFLDIYFPSPGEFILKVDIDNIVLYSAIVRVYESKESTFQRVCFSHLLHLSMFALKRELYTLFSFNKEVFVLSGQQSLVVLACEKYYATMGFQINFLWKGAIAVHFIPAIFSLEIGLGLPKMGMSSEKVLGIDNKDGILSKKDVRAAYYREALQWHPDRWSRYPLYVKRATELFELVNEAYMDMKLQLEI